MSMRRSHAMTEYLAPTPYDGYHDEDLPGPWDDGHKDHPQVPPPPIQPPQPSCRGPRPGWSARRRLRRRLWLLLRLWSRRRVTRRGLPPQAGDRVVAKAAFE
jgi:hypothetical protein